MPVLDTIEVQVGDAVFADVNSAFTYFGQRANTLFSTSLTVPVRRTMMETLRRIHGALASTHGKGWNGKMPTGSSVLFKRSGQGLQDILQGLQVKGSFKDEVVGEVHISGYMALHETGGRITRKRAQYLTIPLPAACDARGLPLKRSAREWSDTFVARSKKGNLLIFQRRGRNVVPLYILKTSVFMPARLKTMEHMETQLPFFEQKIFETISKQLEAF